MLKKKINLSLNQHLRCIDLSQKYLIKNANEIPTVNNILISTDLNSFKTLMNVPEEFIQNYCFFVLYVFSCTAPKIFLSKKNFIGQPGKNFNLKLILKSKLDIEYFLDNILMYLLENEENIRSLKISQVENNFSVYLPILESIDLQNINLKTKSGTTVVFKFNNKDLAKKFFFFKKHNPFWAF